MIKCPRRHPTDSVNIVSTVKCSKIKLSYSNYLLAFLVIGLFSFGGDGFFFEDNLAYADVSFVSSSTFSGATNTNADQTFTIDASSATSGDRLFVGISIDEKNNDAFDGVSVNCDGTVQALTNTGITDDGGNNKTRTEIWFLNADLVSPDSSCTITIDLPSGNVDAIGAGAWIVSGGDVSNGATSLFGSSTSTGDGGGGNSPTSNISGTTDGNMIIAIHGIKKSSSDSPGTGVTESWDNYVNDGKKK